MKLFSENRFGIITFESDAEEKKQMGKVGKQLYILENVPLESGKKLDLIFAVNKKHLEVIKEDIIAACNTYLSGNLSKMAGISSKTKEERKIIGMDMAQVIAQVYQKIQVLFVVDDCQLKEVKGSVMDNIKIGGINILSM